MNIDLTAITAILVGGMLLLIPLAGVTLRYGITPLLAALAELRAAGLTGETASAVNQRLAAMEERIADLEFALEVREGDRKSVA
jgi:hypothetical protein